MIKRKKKLLHIQLLPLLSGVQNMMMCLLDGLDKEEYDIYVISKPGGPLVSAVKQAGYHHIAVPCLRRNISPFDLAALLKIFFIIRYYKFDIVHTHSSKTGFLGRIAAKLGGCRRIIHTVHGFAMHDHQHKAINITYSIMERIAGACCDKVVFVNEYEKEMAVKKRIIPRYKAVTVYNGIKYRDYKYKKADEYLEERDFLQKPFTIGSVLRFTAQKNVVNTIKAAVQVCHLNENIRFVFIGDGEDFIECKAIVEKEKLNQKILLTGWQTNINDLLVKMDVFLLYSRWEGLPISILEAMASGLPVVASDIKGNNELVSDENGILVNVNDTSKLVEVLVSIPARTSQLQKWCINSRKEVETRFGVERFIRSYRALYEN